MLESIRKKNTPAFDGFSEFVKFAIPFLGCFAPALITSTAGLMIGNLLLFSALLTWQWATLTNKADRRVEEEKKKNIEEANILDQLYGEDEKLRIEKAIQEIEKQKTFSFISVNFSHLVSDKVKKLSVEIIQPVDGRMTCRVIDFLQESVNSLEDLLTAHYGIKMRASVKLTVDEKTFKTYARGSNNMESRGGELKAKKLNGKKLLVSKNYAYDAIVNKDLTFFAEGNLTDLHNKWEETDVFFCEYPNFIDIFFATFIMPVRIPKFDQEGHIIYGIVCIDCQEEMLEWSDPAFKNMLGYHIVADYADSLALLLKAFKG